MLPKLGYAGRAVIVGLSILATVPAAMAQQGEDLEVVHDELRAVESRLVAAVNAQDFEALGADLAPDAIVTTMTNDVLRGTQEFEAYMERMFAAPDRVIDRMTVNSADADELSRLYGDTTVAVATGTVDANFKLAVGREFDWPIRWTAVLTRQDDKWLITHAHFSANAIDNPVVSTTGKTLGWLSLATGLLGLLVGYLLARFLRRTATS